MGKQTNHSWLHRLFCLLMALHVINMSVDAPDGYSSAPYNQQGEDLSINDIESVSELILEEWLGFTGMVPEHDESDDDSSRAGLQQYYIFTPPFVCSLFPLSFHHPATDGVPFRLANVVTPVAEIVAPPPQRTI